MRNSRKILKGMLYRLKDSTELIPGLFYKNGYDFILRHGIWFNNLAPACPKGMPELCYMNAIVLNTLYGWRYIEGYALAPNGKVFHHAWNLNNAELIDSTWINNGLAYIGVEFSIGRADDATWTGDASILDDFNRGWPLFREPWKGEDFSKIWPATEGMLMLRINLDKFRAIFEKE